MTQGWLFYVKYANTRRSCCREAHLVGIAGGQEKGQKASRMKIEGSKFSLRDYNNDSMWIVCKSGQVYLRREFIENFNANGPRIY